MTMLASPMSTSWVGSTMATITITTKITATRTPSRIKNQRGRGRAAGRFTEKTLEATPRIELGMEVLQIRAASST